MRPELRFYRYTSNKGTGETTQALFKNIGARDLNRVRQRLENDLDAANLVTKASPNQFAGMPVTITAIGTAVANSRWIRSAKHATHSPAKAELAKKTEKAEEAFDALQHILDAGADALESNTHGGSAIGYPASQARQYLQRHSHNDPE